MERRWLGLFAVVATALGSAGCPPPAPPPIPAPQRIKDAKLVSSRAGESVLVFAAATVGAGLKSSPRSYVYLRRRSLENGALLASVELRYDADRLVFGRDWTCEPRSHTAPGAHFVEQPPQCSGSCVRSRHLPPHATCSGRYMHVPLEAHRWSGPQCASDVHGAPSNAYNAFSSISTASYWTPGNVGWFFYRQVADACLTYFMGQTDTHFGTGGTLSGITLDGPFPTMRFSEAYGMGDYIGIIKRGLPGGYLFPTWARPVQTPASGAACVPCNSAPVLWDLAIYSSQVTP
jgi:hypothetical protein